MASAFTLAADLRLFCENHIGNPGKHDRGCRPSPPVVPATDIKWLRFPAAYQEIALLFSDCIFRPDISVDFVVNLLGHKERRGTQKRLSVTASVHILVLWKSPGPVG